MTNMVERAISRTRTQNERRGPWDAGRYNPIEKDVPAAPPWPAEDDPALGILLERARQEVTEDIETALINLAVHCWFEGHIEGYDRGQIDARAMMRQALDHSS